MINSLYLLFTEMGQCWFLH